jgi:glutamyl-tRNA reductase
MYISKVAMGLLSAIKGDDQIYSQIKKAFNLAKKSGHISTLLERMFQQLVRINKRVMNETNYKARSISLAYQSLKYAKYITQEINNPSLLILGAGELSKQLVKNVSKFDFGRITIANRTKRNAELLKLINKKIDITSLDNIQKKMAEYNIVISCLGTNYNLFDPGEEISNRSLQLYVDLTRQNKKSKVKNSSIHIVDLEDMFLMLNKNESVRSKSIPFLYTIIKEEVENYGHWVESYSNRMLEVAG